MREGGAEKLKAITNTQDFLLDREDWYDSKPKNKNESILHICIFFSSTNYVCTCYVLFETYILYFTYF